MDNFDSVLTLNNNTGLNEINFLTDNTNSTDFSVVSYLQKPVKE